MKEKTRLDLLLVSKGLVETRTKAQALILAGQVEVDGNSNLKAGTAVSPEAVINIKKQNPYVSRGGLKLESALNAFGIDVSGRICLDIGASTGGFTDCLLQRGAVKVYAVDVGHNQMHEKVKNDPRVVNMEGVNFRYFKPEILKDRVEFVTIDVSFISLEKILPAAAASSSENAEILAMVKPQFEASPNETKKGVVRDESVRQKTIEKIKTAAVEAGLEVKGGVDSAVKGPEGNIEHFLWLSKRGKS